MEDSIMKELVLFNEETLAGLNLTEHRIIYEPAPTE